jgi:mono/diheme cytochrome c family protein
MGVMQRGEIVLIAAAMMIGGVSAAQEPQAQVPNGTNARALVFDAEEKHYDASPGEELAPFTFYLTNVWTNEIVIEKVHADCGCMTMKLPAQPWHIAAGADGKIEARINLAGKTGSMVKSLTVYTSAGQRVLRMRVDVPAPPASGGALSGQEREAAVVKAREDGQAIFKGGCAKCHADKGRGAMGEDLYAADCGICHESPRRKGFVPDLHAMKERGGLEYWRAIIAEGKAHTLMPGFGAANGGPLTEEQVASLAAYLNRTISHQLAAPTASNVGRVQRPGTGASQ